MKKIFLTSALLTFGLAPFSIHAQIKSKIISSESLYLLKVTSPVPNGDALLDGFSYDKAGRIKFTIIFNRPVNISSVVVRQTLILSFSKDQNAGASLSWSADKKTLTIITEKTSGQLLSFTPDAGFKLTLKGTRRDASTIGSVRFAPGGVIAENGHFLDGDNNSKDGGDYNVYFRIIG